MVSDDGAHSIAIPGGTRALQLSGLVDIYFDDEEPNAVISIPSLQGAIVAKVSAAVDERTERQIRHVQDTVFLLGLIERPQDIRSTWPASDIAPLRQLVDRLRYRRHVAWEFLTDEAIRRAQAVLDLATS